MRFLCALLRHPQGRARVYDHDEYEVTVRQCWCAELGVVLLTVAPTAKVVPDTETYAMPAPGVTWVH